MTPPKYSEGTLPVYCQGAHSQALQPGRSADSAGAHSQAGTANPQPRQAVLLPPARKGCRHFPKQPVVVPQARKKWVNLVPAAVVIPAPLVYIKVVAVNSS